MKIIKEGNATVKVYVCSCVSTTLPASNQDGFDLISDRLPYGPIWYAGPDAIRYAAAYAKYHSWSQSRRAIIRVLDELDATVCIAKSVGDFRE